MAAPKSRASSQGAPEIARRRVLQLSIAGALAAAGPLAVAPAVDARVTKIQVTTKESPTFGGHSFAGVG